MYSTWTVKSLMIVIDKLSFASELYNLNVLHLNICSPMSKCDQLMEMILWLEIKVFIDFVCLNETWLNHAKECICKIPGVSLECLNRQDRSAGGVVIMIRNNINYTRWKDLDFCDNNMECLFIEVEGKHKHNVILGSICRFPGTNECDFLSKYKTIVEKLKVEHKEIILSMDQNLDYLKANYHHNTMKFLDMNLSNLNSQPYLDLHVLQTPVLP